MTQRKVETLYVRALGQIELLFTFAAGALVFGERARRSELVGVALIVAAVSLILLSDGT